MPVTERMLYRLVYCAAEGLSVQQRKQSPHTKVVMGLWPVLRGSREEHDGWPAGTEAQLMLEESGGVGLVNSRAHLGRPLQGLFEILFVSQAA